MTDTPVKPPTTQEAVLARLRRAFAAGELRPGDQIRQELLAEKYGVSRVPVREALRILEGEGRVTYRPHRGYFVAELSVDDLLEVYRLRELLEAESIASAVPRLTDADLARLRSAAESVRDATGLDSLSEANRRFHFLLFEAAGRPVLLRLLTQLWDATDAYRTVYFSSPQNRARVEQEHADLLSALERRDVSAAVDHQAAHRQHSVAALQQQLHRYAPRSRAAGVGNGASASRSSSR